MNFIVETDLGHDPDDFLTLCHLVTAGHTIRAVSIVPGGPEQVGLAHMIRTLTGQDFRIGRAKATAKSEALGVHDDLMEQEGFGPGVPDGPSADILAEAFRDSPTATDW